VVSCSEEVFFSPVLPLRYTQCTELETENSYEGNDPAKKNIKIQTYYLLVYDFCHMVSWLLFFAGAILNVLILVIVLIMYIYCVMWYC